MQSIDTLKAACDWTLMRGSHDFPGPAGGTCINEAALVAAGFKYRKVTDAGDMPECFSRVISQFAIGLNDSMTDQDRQRLIPFVTRLAGTADVPEIEQKRAELLVKSLVNNVISRIMTRLGNADLAQACAKAETMEECRTVSRQAAAAAAARYAAAAAAARYAADAAARYAADAAARYAADAARYAADAAARYAADAARYAADAALKEERKFLADWGIGVLEGMLAIGKQADPVETALVTERMEVIKAVAREREAA